MSQTTTFIIPSNVASILQGAFENCVGITKITIPPSVTVIGDNALSGTTSLSSITFLGSILPSISNNTFGSSGSVIPTNLEIRTSPNVDLTTLNASLSAIGISVTIVANIYQDSQGLIYTLDISNNTASVTGYAENPVTISIPVTILVGVLTYNVTSIGANVFSNCNRLSTIIFESTTTLPTIGLNAFQNIASTYKVIYNYTISDTTVLTVPSGGNFIVGSLNIKYTDTAGISYLLPNTGSTASFYSYVYNGNTSLILSDKVVYNTIEYNVTSIEDNCFSGFTNLISIYIPNTITDIGIQAFKNCTSLLSVTIPKTITTISDNTFEGCSSLSSILIPNTVTTFGNSVFKNCSGLSTITFLHETAPQFGTNGFLNISSNCTINSYPSIRTSLTTQFNNYPSVTKTYQDLHKNTDASGNQLIYILLNGTLLASLCTYITIQSTINIPAAISVTTSSYGIKSIEDNAFNGASNLSSITFDNKSILPTLGINSFANMAPIYTIYYYSSVINPLAVSNPFNLNSYIHLAGINTRYIRSILPDGTITCFKEGTKILTDKGYISVENLRKGDLVKTIQDGYKAIFMIGKTNIDHKASNERIKDQLYKFSKNEYTELFEDLIITGCHSILVNEFKEGQREKTLNFLKDIFITEDKYRLPACLDESAMIYEMPGSYTIYHFALENENIYNNYGVNANGMLVESCSKRFIEQFSTMVLIE